MGLFKSCKSTLIGESVSGTVSLCERNDQQYVVKKYRSKENYETRKEYRDRVLLEYHTLKQLHHENFISVIKYKVLIDGLTIKMFMDAGTSNLAQLCKKVPVSLVSISEILCLWKQLCNGVRYLHSQGLCHRDLKLENLVMDRAGPTLKIIDLATACKCENGQKAVGIVGSRLYMAPETFSQIEYDGKSADVWSVGIVLLYLANRSFPWGSAVWNDGRFAEYSKIESAQADQLGAASSNPLFSNLPTQIADLDHHLLAIDPLLRYDMETIHTYSSQIPYCGSGSSCGTVHLLR